MKLCFLVSEYFRWGKFGGYGTSTRVLSTELVLRGFDVTVLTPQRGEQPAQERVDGVRIIAYPAQQFAVLERHCRELAADVYHSHEPSLAAVIARRAVPRARHLITCRDTRLLRDWLIEMGAWIRDGNWRTLLSFPYENNPWVARAVRSADGVYCPNQFSQALTKKKYALRELPGFLPSPVRVPGTAVPKAATPTVCFLGRWDARKRPALFLDLAQQFPEVQFRAIGKARTADYERDIRQRYAAMPNVELAGFIDQFDSPRFDELLGSCWVLINTSLREGLPRSFLEAGARGCAILSRVDPDHFAARFGFCADRDNFAQGLAWLLEQDRWRMRGEAARVYVSATYRVEVAVAAHVRIYQAAHHALAVPP